MKEVYVAPEMDFIMIESMDILMISSDSDLPFEGNEE